MKDKLIDLNQLKALRDFSLGYGHFTTIHSGHIRYLKHAKSLAANLVIALKGDGDITNEDNLPYEFNQKERAEALLMLDIADAVLLLKDEELSEIVKVISPKILVLGKQFEINPETTINDERIWNIPHEAKLITYDYVSNFKGLESDIIILVDIDRSLDIIEDVYVGLSRAKSQLYIISGKEAISKLKELNSF